MRGRESVPDILEHIDRCGSCRTLYENILKIESALGNVPTAQLPPGFADSVISKIECRTYYTPRTAWKPAFSFFCGAAAVILIFILVGRRSNPVKYIPPQETAFLASYTRGSVLFEGNMSYLKLDLHSTKSIEDVTITMDLPEGLILSDNTHSVSWSGDLQEGHNIILLKVRGNIEGSWEIEGSLRKNDTQKTFRKSLRVI